ncbi:hypothetical protein VM1G_11344 [Cytospora mali]|uniref:Uncharacterized protein n=1 Tax=Cytospora mali TaxID=578113 RepID=A0A194VLX0_CYTMA|nr:hypothetical protein VM1G_11344 [Valsa mali]
MRSWEEEEDEDEDEKEEGQEGTDGIQGQGQDDRGTWGTANLLGWISSSLVSLIIKQTRESKHYK